MSENEKRLAEENMGLVYFLVKKHYPNYAFDEDIHQIGMIGLCKAAQRWDSDKGAFSTFAGKCILSEIRREFLHRYRLKRRGRVVSLNTPVGCDKWSSRELADFIVGESDVQYFDREEFYSKLTPQQRTILELCCQGKSRREVGSILGISHSWVNAQLRKANMMWRKMYED